MLVGGNHLAACRPGVFQDLAQPPQPIIEFGGYGFLFRHYGAVEGRTDGDGSPHLAVADVLETNDVPIGIGDQVGAAKGIEG